jgi:hypothetical protein
MRADKPANARLHGEVQGVLGAPRLAQRHGQMGLELGIGAVARRFLERSNRLARPLLPQQQDT